MEPNLDRFSRPLWDEKTIRQSEAEDELAAYKERVKEEEIEECQSFDISKKI